MILRILVAWLIVLPAVVLIGAGLIVFWDGRREARREPLPPVPDLRDGKS